MQDALRDDALTSTAAGFALRIGLPWIRSLPLSGIGDLSVTVDGEPVDVRVALGGRGLAPSDLAGARSWWYLQDRLVLEADRALAPGGHDVVVTFRTRIPYLMAGPDGGPLELPMRLAARLELDHAARPSVSLDVA